MGRASPGFRNYRLAVALGGLFFLAFLLMRWGQAIARDWPEVLLFAFLSIVSESLKINLQKSAAMSVSFLVTFSALLLFGPAAAALIEAVSIFNWDDLRLRLPALTMGFNAGQLAISMGLAGIVYLLAGGTYGNPSHLSYPFALLPIFLAAATFFLANTFFVSIYVGIAEDSSPLSIWAYQYEWMVPNHLALTVIGVVLAYLYSGTGAVGISLLIIPLLIARQTFQVYMKLKNAYLETVRSLVQALEAKDPYTRGHSERVAEYAEKIARYMKFSEAMIEMIRYAALLHDVGKIGVSRKILSKPGKLSSDEYQLIQEHPKIGAQIIHEVDFLREPLSAVLYHHEHVDGNGYAFGLKGEEIPLMARILTVADSFDAMTSARPYRNAMSVEDAYHELIRCSGSQFDSATVQAFLDATDYYQELESRKGAEEVVTEKT